MSFGYIYLTTNLINNKLYVGRKKGQFTTEYLGSGIYFRAAVKKYGRNNFKVIKLAEAESNDELNKLEIEYIAKYRNLVGNEQMYNISDGGICGAGTKYHKLDCRCIWCKITAGEVTGKDHPFYGHRHTKEVKQKLSKMRMGKKNGFYGKHHNLQTRLRWTNRINGMFGKKHRESSNEKNRASHLGKVVSKSSKRKISNHSKNSRWIYNKLENIERFVLNTEITSFLHSGWKLGRLKRKVNSNE